jgi:hypothetical protein
VTFRTEDFPLGLKPIAQCVTGPRSAFQIDLIGSPGDADVHIIREGRWLAVNGFFLSNSRFRTRRR